VESRLPGIAPERPGSRPEICKFSKNLWLRLRRPPLAKSYTLFCKVKFLLLFWAGICASFSFHFGRARLRRALAFSSEIESRLDGVSPYRKKMPNELQSQRDWIIQPRVGPIREGLPWVVIILFHNPERVASHALEKKIQPFQGCDVSVFSPRVARSSQPWAERFNPFGIGKLRFMQTRFSHG